MDLFIELSDIRGASIRPSDYGKSEKWKPMCFAENEDGKTCQGMIDLSQFNEPHIVIYDTCMECKYFGREEYDRIINCGKV